MSLRLRLTFLYTALLGGTLLISGGLLYSVISVLMMDQIDANLTQVAYDVIRELRVNYNNQVDPRSLARFQIAENKLIQVWGYNSQPQLIYSTTGRTALDEVGLHLGHPIFNSVTYDKFNLRILSVPLVTQRGPLGILQIGQNLSLIELTRRMLVVVFIILTILAMIWSGLAVWLVNGQALAPLNEVTRMATQITRADDLSKRILIDLPPEDEIGLLVVAFNQTIDRLEKLFTAQRRFMADVSHDLRTPLTVIKGNVGLMRKFGEMDEESLSSIETEVDRLTRLVGDLLILAQAESGKLPLSMNQVELDTILLEVFNQMHTLASDRLQLKISEIDQVVVVGDRDRLKQMLLNLVGNAIQYTPTGGEVNLSLRKSGNQVQLIVSDTGQGISAQDIPHIFERFYRGEKSRKRSQSSGFGLGLSIAYWIVKNHGGHIDVNSSEGKGTTFSVWLPLAK